MKTTLPKNPLVRLADGKLARKFGNGIRAFFLPWLAVSAEKSSKSLALNPTHCRCTLVGGSR